MPVNLTEEQQKIHDKLLDWMNNVSWDGPGGANNRESLVGYAGTGKTTLLGMLASSLETSVFMSGRKIAFCAYTGKATSVLRKKLEASDLNPGSYDCGTIHSLFFTTDRCAESTSESKFFLKDPVLICDKYCLVIIDEASMVGQDLYNMLKDIDVPILLVGDPGQLPPVNQKSPEILMKSKNKLETVHRQALGNPIINLATQVRLGIDVKSFEGSNVKGKLFAQRSAHKTMINVREQFLKVAHEKENIILCGFNSTRIRVNKQIREMRGYDELPVFGEKLVNLSNNKELNMMNGQLFYVYSAKSENKDFYSVELIREDHWFGTGEDYEDTPMIRVVSDKNTLHNANAGNYIGDRFKDFYYKSEATYVAENAGCINSSVLFFDFGYCLSVHKSQGSEWKKVFFINDKLYEKEPASYRRWLYTGITRASEMLVMEV